MMRTKTRAEERSRDESLSEEASEAKEVRIPYVPSRSENDLQPAASGGDNEEAESSREEIGDDIDISESEENSRSKRLGMFGNLLGGFSGGGNGGSGGGSGNFLFDIIRLVAGSGATEQQDENANAPLAPTGSDQSQPLPADDGYQAGIPGPITRLFVIANRGIANLMQDLILRLAQTSERIVNFKARLITAII
ncbi:UNVERIFIED_CONTAM: hypothetical protein PYX00_010775 [Menopon gallinae]|uniref:Uncharacterized protein n=1 Tax=Menopon gallinae TaxID=328185 RepID=A0AAW2HH32_9NEOP